MICQTLTTLNSEVLDAMQLGFPMVLWLPTGQSAHQCSQMHRHWEPDIGFSSGFIETTSLQGKHIKLKNWKPDAESNHKLLHVSVKPFILTKGGTRSQSYLSWERHTRFPSHGDTNLHHPHPGNVPSPAGHEWFEWWWWWPSFSPVRFWFVVDLGFYLKRTWSWPIMKPKKKTKRTINLLRAQLSEISFASHHVLATRDHARRSVDISLWKGRAVEVLILNTQKETAWYPDKFMPLE